MAPPDLCVAECCLVCTLLIIDCRIVGGNFRVNWRTAWSFFDESLPIGEDSFDATSRGCSCTRT